MIDDTICGLFEQLSAAKNLEYHNVPLPYRPFGEARGVIGNYVVRLYIYQHESRISRSYDTVFTTTGYNFLPKGFCVERKVDPYGESRSFDDRIIIRSYDEEAVHKYLDAEKKVILEDVFTRVDELENSLFKVRSLFRLSDEEIILSIGKMFTEIGILKEVYTSVNYIFTSLLSKLDK